MMSVDTWVGLGCVIAGAAVCCNGYRISRRRTIDKVAHGLAFMGYVTLVNFLMALVP